MMKLNPKFRDICYSESPTDEQRKKVFEELHSKLEPLNKHLETHKFFAGDYLTIADIAFYETMQCAKIVHPESFKSYHNFEKHAQSFESQEWF